MVHPREVFVVRDRRVGEVIVVRIGSELGHFLFQHLGHGVEDLYFLL
jgi:hypothetical protein